jgi:hypothetical protein
MAHPSQVHRRRSRCVDGSLSWGYTDSAPRRFTRQLARPDAGTAEEVAEWTASHRRKALDPTSGRLT